MGDSGVSLEDKNADRNADSEDCAYEVSEGNEDSGTGVEAIHVIYYLRVCLYFVHALELWVRLRLKVMDEFIW